MILTFDEKSERSACCRAARILIAAKVPESDGCLLRLAQFFQLQVYAFLVGETQGEIPEELRLLYLGSGDDLRTSCSAEMVDETVYQLRTVWRDILAACAAGNFPARTSPLCSWCSFKDECPAFASPETD